MFKNTIVGITTVILMTVSFGHTALAQKPAIRWMNISEADSLTSDKPYLIDLYTYWCGWCKVMDEKTYTNAKLVAYVQQKFSPVKFDAEFKAAIKWKGRTFKFSESRRVNEFANYVTGGRLAFPTTVIIPPGNGEPQAIPGYLKPRDLEVILKYFGEEVYKTKSFADYKKGFKTDW